MPRKKHTPEEIVAAAAGGCPCFARGSGGRRDQVDWGDRGDVLSVEAAVWRAEAGPGEAAEGTGA